MTTPSISEDRHRPTLDRISLGDDDFTVLGLPRQYAQDPAALDRQWRLLQSEVHPDRHVSADAAVQRLATQWSVRINEAYQRLRHPLRRAAYLCELNDAAVNAESNTAMSSDFLQQQWAWREALEEARTASEVQALQAEVGAVERQLLDRVAQELDVLHDHTRAAQTVRSLLFLNRFMQDVDRRGDELSP